jgi:hypothetical protein
MTECSRPCATGSTLGPVTIVRAAIRAARAGTIGCPSRPPDRAIGG